MAIWKKKYIQSNKSSIFTNTYEDFPCGAMAQPNPRSVTLIYLNVINQQHYILGQVEVT